MEDFFSSIGVCTIIIGVIYLLIRSSERKEDKEKENEDLFKYTYRSEENFDKTISRAKNIEKVLSQPSVRREAEERRKKGQEIMAADEDRRRKDKILKRTYSYQYEDVIYEIFSPLAVQEENSWMAKKYGKWRLHKSIDKFFFQSEIARILRMSEDEASELMFQFEKNDMIQISTIPNTWKHTCSLGTLLEYDWNIISNQDKNISTWMEAHPNVESKESFEKRQNDFVQDKYK